MLDILYFILAFIVLIASGTFLVRNLIKIAHFLRLSEFSAAFIIMAVATSMPELFVGISSALAKTPTLSLGNVIGASIIDLTLITAIVIIIGKEIRIKTESIDKDIYFMLTAIVLIIILYIIGNSLSRIDGIILFSLFIINSVRKLKERKKYRKKLKERIKNWVVVLNSITFTLAFIALFLSSRYVVKYSSNLAVQLNVPQIVIGFFLISFATTLPELAFGISAVRMKHKGMSLGDLLGGVTTNASLVLGVVSIISPIKTDFFPFLISSIFMFVVAFLFATFIKTGRKLEKIEAISLIFIYILFVIIEIFINIIDKI